MSDRIMVMNRGRIEQVGTPMELYEDPATPFVADFTVRPISFPDAWMLKTLRPLSWRGCAQGPHGASEPARKGVKRALLVVRPENLGFSQDGAASPCASSIVCLKATASTTKW